MRIGREKVNHISKMITDLHKKKIKILDLQITGDNLILVLGEKE